MRRKPIIVNRNHRYRRVLGPVVLDGIAFPLTSPVRVSAASSFPRSARFSEISFIQYPDRKDTYSLTLNTNHDSEERGE